MAEQEFACASCGRIVAETIAGIAGRLGRCRCSHSPDKKLVPVAPAEEVAAFRERRASEAAYRRAKIKSQTDEGRKKMTPREAAELAKREA